MSNCPNCGFDPDGGAGRCPACGFFEEAQVSAELPAGERELSEADVAALPEAPVDVQEPSVDPTASGTPVADPVVTPPAQDAQEVA